MPATVIAEYAGSVALLLAACSNATYTNSLPFCCGEAVPGDILIVGFFPVRGGL
jgi:hypothetical protein